MLFTLSGGKINMNPFGNCVAQFLNVPLLIRNVSYPSKFAIGITSENIPW